MSDKDMAQIVASLRADIDEASDNTLRESLQQYGWVKAFPAIQDEHGTTLVGNRRLRLAREMNISPEIITLTIGSGERADIERVKLAVVSNIGGRPLTRDDRQRIAVTLYQQHGWTQAKIGEALGVSTMTVSRYLEGFNVPLKPPPRPKGGRPKNKLKPKARKNESAEAKKAAKQILDEGKSYDAAAQEAGVSETVIRAAVAREEGRREATEAVGLIDASTLSMTAQEKLAAAIRQHQRELDARFEQRVQDEWRRGADEMGLPAYRETYEKLKNLLERRGGVFTRVEYNKLLFALSPDHQPDVAQKTEAYRLFLAKRLALCDEKEMPHNIPLRPVPRSMAEWEARKQAVKDERSAKRMRTEP